MTLRNVLLVYRKELTDLLRDKRTIISLVLAPMLVGPLLMVGMNYWMTRARAEARVQRFKTGVQMAIPLPGLREGLQAAGLDPVDVADARAATEKKDVSFGVAVGGSADRPTVTIYSDNSEMMIGAGRGRVSEVLDRLRDQKVRAELAARNVPADVLQPFVRESVNIAQPRKMTGSILGTVVGFLLLIFLFNGAMFAAVDATAGEKERRTIEMLLSSAAKREEIVTAKVLLSLTSAATNAMLSLVSYAVAFKMTEQRNSGPQSFNLVFPTDAVSLTLIVLLIIPIAVVAASIAVAGAVRAKSTREATSYLTPGMFVVMFLGMVTFIPSLQQQMMIAVVPFANFSAMLRQVLLGDWSWAQYGLTVFSNLLYGVIATALAVRSFCSEKVLFRT